MTSVRIAHPIGGRPSPDLFGKTFHVASPLQDSVVVITPSSLHYIATTRGAYPLASLKVDGRVIKSATRIRIAHASCCPEAETSRRSV